MSRRTFAWADDSTVSAHATPMPPASGVRARSGYSRARATIERRTPMVRRAPAREVEEVVGVVLEPGAIAPYDPTPEHVPARTRAVILCPFAATDARHSSECAGCAGSGKMLTWIEIEIVREQRVLVTGAGAARERHTAALDVADFEQPAEWPNQLLHQAWFRGVPPHLAAELRPDLASNERVLWLLVQTFVG